MPKRIVGSAVIAICLAGALNLVATSPSWGVVITFGTSADFTSNFRPQSAAGASTYGQTSAVNGPDGTPGVLRLTSQSASGALVNTLYDTTPANNAVQNTFLNETVQADFRMSTAGQTFGLFARVIPAETAGYLVQISVDASGTNERIQILDSDITSTPGGTPLVTITTSTSVLNLNTYYTLRLTPTNVGGNVLLNADVLAIGGTTSLLNASVTDTTLPLTSAGEIGVRHLDLTGAASTSVDADNFSVPEPASLGTLGIAAIGFLARRRGLQKGTAKGKGAFI